MFPSATIILHEGHASIGRAACVSSCKVLAAARGILNLLYDAYSTSHNLALLGVFPTVRSSHYQLYLFTEHLTGVVAGLLVCGRKGVGAVPKGRH